MSEQKHKGKNIRTLLLIFVVITLFYCTGYAQQGTLTWLGTLGGSSSMASGVSDDGLVVTGYSRNLLNENIAFRWTAVTGMQSLGTLGGNSSEATGISSNGSVIVGWAYVDGSMYKAFKWTATGMVDLGAGDFSRATAISADGSTIVGYRYEGTGQNGFRFKTNYEDLGSLGANLTGASGVSTDGSVIVGYSYKISGGDPYAFRWVDGTGMQQIGNYYTFPNGVSGDGSIVTGSETGSAGLHRAFRWTLSGGVEYNIAGNFSQGNAVSGNGTIIVGDYSGGAFRLSTTGGLEGLNTVYSNLLTTGSNLYTALDVSSDGQFIVGYGKNGITGNNEGYILAIGGTTSIDKSPINPGSFVLYQNFPNPFHESTKINYKLTNSGQIILRVYDLSGKEIKTLVNEIKPAGIYEVDFDGSKITEGMYIYELQTGLFKETKKMILLK